MLIWLYLYEQEQQSTDSRPKFCEGEEQSPDAYGEAMAILAGLDREFAFNNPAAPATTVAPTKPHVDGKDPRFIERCTKCKSYETFRRLSTRQYLLVRPTMILFAVQLVGQATVIYKG